MTETYRWATTGDKTEPPEAKKDAGNKAGFPEAAEYNNWALDALMELRHMNGLIGDIGNPLLHLPLLNSLAIARGVGSVTFARSTTGTYVDRYGVVQTAAIDEPRFERNGLLMEGASTNLAFRSDDFNDAYWSKTQASITPNDIAAPNGVAASADKLVDTAVNTSHFTNRSVVAATDPTVPNAISVFARADEITQISLRMQDDGLAGTVRAIFDLSVGTVVSATETGTGANATGTIQALADGWYRCKLTGTPASTGSTVAGLVLLAKSGSTSYLGNGTDGAHIWGAHLEELPFVSSYISTVATAVTRTADFCSLTVVGNIPLQADSTTIMVDFDTLGNDPATGQEAIRVVGESNRLIRLSVAGFFQGNYGTASMLTTNAPLSNTVHRVGIRYDSVADEASTWVAGIKELAASSPDVSDALGTPIEIGNTVGATPLWGHVANVRIYDRALSDRAMTIA